MKTFAALLSLSLFLQSVSAFPLTDAFTDYSGSGGTTYSVGAPLSAQNLGGSNVWASLGSVNANSIEPTIVLGNLSYPGVPASTGNSVSVQPATAMSARLNITNGIGPILGVGTRAYYSVLLKVTDLSAVPTVASTNQICGFSDGTVGQPNKLARVSTRLLTKKITATTFVVGLGRSDVTTDMVYDTTVHNINETLFIVCAHEAAGGTVTNEYMWINPATNSFGTTNVPAPTLTSSVTGSTGAGSMNAGIQGFVIMCQYNIEPSAVLDELRIGTNWSYITGGDPAITQAPANQVAVPGGTAVFTVAARGTPTLSYQWSKGGTPLSNGGNITGATTTALTVSGISGSDIGSYTVAVTNGLGAGVTSPFATLTAADPGITAQPQGITKDYGTTATFHVGATGTPTIGYQWRKNGSNLSDGGNVSGSVTDTLTVSGVASADTASYSVVVTNALSSATSSDAVLLVNDPIIVSQPTATSAILGGSTTFHVVAAGTPSLAYQWKKNGAIIFDTAVYSGTSSDTLTVTNVTATEAGSYSVLVIGGSGNSINSGSPILSISSPASIYGQPTARMVSPGGTTTVAVGTTGTQPVFYQWYHNGNLVTGATNIALGLTNVAAGDLGSYYVVVSNAYATVTSAIGTVNFSVTPNLAPTNLVVIRVGTGNEALGNTGNSMALDQYTQNGSLLNTLSVPNNGANAMLAFGFNNASGTTGNVTGTGLTRSADGRQMVIAGYCTNLSNTAVLTTSPTRQIPRGIGFVNSLGQYTQMLASTNGAFDGNLWRLALSDGTNNFWGTGNQPGLYYFGFDATNSLVETNFMNIRSAGIFNGDMYCVGAVAGLTGVMKINGGGLQKTFVGGTVLTNIPGSTSSADMEMNTNGTIIYVANDNGSTPGGVERYNYDGTSWAYAYTLPMPGVAGARYVTADFSGANPVIYAVSKESDNNSVVKFVDTGSGSTGTAIAWAGGNQVFRGLRLGPTVTVPVVNPTIAFTHDASNVVLSWIGAFTLQSSTNVAGGYSDVTTSSPYTNATSGDAQRFYRLHQ